MGYELRTQTVEPIRNTFQSLIDRFGDKPASRYQEGTYELQPTENFHYRPFWDPAHEIYDPDYTALKLTDPYTYSDPRQFYYATYVASRADHYDAFAKDLAYVEQRSLFDLLPENWHAMMMYALVPLRHYESAGELISINACRFAWGTTISQAAAFAAMDRIGNAQLLSMVGLALGGGAGDKLTEAKEAWLERSELQGLRELVEQAMIEKDWATSLLALEFVDAQLYPLLFRHLDDRALSDGAMSYSLIAQHFSKWYTDHRKWLTALLKAWVSDAEHGEANRQALGEIVARWYPQSRRAVARIAEGIEKQYESESMVSEVDRLAVELGTQLEGLGIAVNTEK